VLAKRDVTTTTAVPLEFAIPGALQRELITGSVCSEFFSRGKLCNLVRPIPIVQYGAFKQLFGPT
jgi:hypothetical protein